jgi:hypothetical protein
VTSRVPPRLTDVADRTSWSPKAVGVVGAGALVVVVVVAPPLTTEVEVVEVEVAVVEGAATVVVDVAAGRTLVLVLVLVLVEVDVDVDVAVDDVVTGTVVAVVEVLEVLEVLDVLEGTTVVVVEAPVVVEVVVEPGVVDVVVTPGAVDVVLALVVVVPIWPTTKSASANTKECVVGPSEPAVIFTIVPSRRYATEFGGVAWSEITISVSWYSPSRETLGRVKACPDTTDPPAMKLLGVGVW